MYRVGLIAKRTGKFAAAALFCLVGAAATAALAAEARPLPQAHAHNDYHHRQPLHDALRHGFCSVEADIFLQEGKLLVGHDLHELRTDRTLQALYLEPLRKRVASRGGVVYGGNPRFTLLVDIKSDGPTTYAKLSEVLAGYQELCSSVVADKLTQRGVDVVVSGNRPIREILASSPRRVFLDGRVHDLDSPMSAHVMPLVSDNWSKHFEWRGRGPLPKLQQAKLLQLVDRVHQQGRRLRFWATPDDPQVWQVLADADVDLIGTDDLGGLQRFLSSRDSAAVAPIRAEPPDTSTVPNPSSGQD